MKTLEMIIIFIVIIMGLNYCDAISIFLDKIFFLNIGF